MDNLMTFEEGPDGNNILSNDSNKPKFFNNKPICSALPNRNETSYDKSSPFDQIQNLLEAECDDNPFELGWNQDNATNLIDGSAFSFESFITNSTTAHESSIQKVPVSRSQSLAGPEKRKASLKTNHSADNIILNRNQQSQQLLKLSLYNARNSPLKSSSFIANPERAFGDGKIHKSFDPNDISFDLENISSPNLFVDNSLIQNNSITYNDDLNEMKINVLDTPQKKSSSISPSQDKIAFFQEQLKRIKNEVPANDLPIKNDDSKKQQHCEETKVENLDQLLENLKLVINEGNKEEAKKQLQHINEKFLKSKDTVESKTSNTLVVQPIVRQGTFDIDQETGKRKYYGKETASKTQNEDLLEKLTKLLGSQTVNTLDLEGGGAKIIVIQATPSATPIRTSSRRSMSLSMPHKPQSALKALENKKLETPLKRLSRVIRPSALTAPRPSLACRSNDTNQKDIQLRAGAVRKSLLSSIDKSPQMQKSKASIGAIPKTVSRITVKRSASLKGAVPLVVTTNPSPAKIRPSSGAPYAAVNKRLSQAPVKLSSTATKAIPAKARITSDQKTVQFKAPSVVRRAKASSEKGSLV